MKISFKSLFGCLLFLSLVACDSKKDVNARVDKQITKASCIPEAKLLAKGIVNGTIVSRGDAEDKTVILLLDKKNASVCTAAAIAPNILLTAAHCVKPESKEQVAIFYPSISCESGFDINRDSIAVERVVRHEGYDQTKKIKDRTDDIAVVYLSSNIPAGYPIYQIADPEQLSDTSVMQLYGYGDIGEKKGGAAILRKASIDRAKYTLWPKKEEKTEDNQKPKVPLYVLINQKDSSGLCYGDSGGPGLVMQQNELKILSVNSKVTADEGDICNDVGIQTLVAPYADWIKLHLTSGK